MTPKEKAKSLLSSFSFFEYNQIEGIKIANPTLELSKIKRDCAYICCMEILNELVPSDFKDESTYREQKEYWESVKTELIRL